MMKPLSRTLELAIQSWVVVEVLCTAKSWVKASFERAEMRENESPSTYKILGPYADHSPAIAEQDISRKYYLLIGMSPLTVGLSP